MSYKIAECGLTRNLKVQMRLYPHDYVHVCCLMHLLCVVYSTSAITTLELRVFWVLVVGPSKLWTKIWYEIWRIASLLIFFLKTMKRVGEKIAIDEGDVIPSYSV